MSRLYTQQVLAIFCVLAGLLFSLVAFAETKGKPKGPNIVVFFSDDAGFHHFSHFGGAVQTPDIDRLAQEGATFSNAFSPSAVCTPSRFSLMTGMYAGRSEHPAFKEQNPAGEPYRVTWNTFLTRDNTPIHKILSANGYHTGYVGKWHISDDHDVNLPNIARDANLNDPEVDQALQNHQAVLGDFISKMTGADVVKNVFWENSEQVPVKQLQVHHPEWLTQGAVEFIDQRDKQKPFFLFVAVTHPHGPNAVDTLKANPNYTPEGKVDIPFIYHPPRETIKTRLTEFGVPFNHDNVGAVFLNDQVAGIRKKLKQINQDDNTVFILLSDHNSEPGKATTYDAGTRIPMLMKWPNNIPRNTLSEHVVQVTDILPTILDIANITPPASLNLDGRSIMPALQGEAPAREEVFLEMGWTRAVRTKKYKYVALRYPRRIIREMQNGIRKEAPNHLDMPTQGQPNIAMLWYPYYFDPDQLYDLENDPREQHNLAYDPQYASVLSDMKVRMKRYTRKLDPHFNVDDSQFLESSDFKRLAAITRSKAKSRLPSWASGIKWRIGPEALYKRPVYQNKKPASTK